VLRRAVIIVLDSVGLGALPDASAYGDAGTHTLLHVDQEVGGLHLPHMETLGLGRLERFVGIKPVARPRGCYAKLAELSVGKDTIIGHWEIAGLVQTSPFPTYPRGFPPEVVEPFSRAIGRGVLGNVPASGTEIIKRLGAEHLRTGRPILYTSADSVFQLAAHKEAIRLEELYAMCQKAREMLVPPHHVLRVIARPFTGKAGGFSRTPRRRDFSLPPPGETLLDKARKAGLQVVGIGKIGDIFGQRGLDKIIHTESNEEGVEAVLECLRVRKPGLILANLVDFDMIYGHRNDGLGYARALEAFDARLPEIMQALCSGEALFLTSDHGCDPTHPGTDHTREHAFLLVYSPDLCRGLDLGLRRSFADIGQSIAQALNLEPLSAGVSFWNELKKMNP